MKPLISLQLYTVRDAMKQDPMATLERVAQIGYQGVEAGYPASDAFVDKCRELGLKITGVHTSIEKLQQDFDGLVAQQKQIDNSFVIISWVDENRRGSAEKWKETAKTLEELGARLHEEGLTLCYHNHDFEFEQFDGEYGLDVLYNNANPQYLQTELDTYWVQKGGANPVEYLKKYAGRTPVLHIKDMTPDGKFAEIGAGVLDWPAIFAAAEAGGVTAYVVEQDTCPGDPFDSIALSMENLKKMGKI